MPVAECIFNACQDQGKILQILTIDPWKNIKICQMISGKIGKFAKWSLETNLVKFIKWVLD